MTNDNPTYQAIPAGQQWVREYVATANEHWTTTEIKYHTCFRCGVMYSSSTFHQCPKVPKINYIEYFYNEEGKLIKEIHHYG